ncbi:MAG: TIM barrel protein, partial [Spirochaetales bacterium]|nr:TIM barrel protein [Spirochaetales bacterium]
MKLGTNSVLFGPFTTEEAFKYTKMAGYDGIELSAIDGMSEHLVIARWQENASEIKRLASDYELDLLAMEQPSQELEVMEAAMQAAVEIGIPIINCGPGGDSDEDSLKEAIDSLGKLSLRAEHYGVTLCVKAHVGAAIYNTPTTLKVLE